ncbi:hypothetical protein [Actinacidiphila alni]|uniref:hypothetical protein n=1 Tax=Actinacidiphila alni TaxID=380248 RepID=UPI00116065A0|nr:hypothetical protein [Actinacidiphila alni]
MADPNESVVAETDGIMPPHRAGGAPLEPGPVQVPHITGSGTVAGEEVAPAAGARAPASAVLNACPADTSSPYEVDALPAATEPASNAPRRGAAPASPHF